MRRAANGYKFGERLNNRKNNRLVNGHELASYQDAPWTVADVSSLVDDDFGESGVVGGVVGANHQQVLPGAKVIDRDVILLAR